MLLNVLISNGLSVLFCADGKCWPNTVGLFLPRSQRERRCSAGIDSLSSDTSLRLLCACAERIGRGVNVGDEGKRVVVVDLSAGGSVTGRCFGFGCDNIEGLR